MPARPPSCGCSLRASGLLVLGVALALVPVVARAAESPVLRVVGMTFVGSEGSVSELIVRSERALFHPDTNVAQLEEVEAVVTDQESRRSLEMTCDRAELNVETNDLLAEGHVKGVTGDGQRYSAPWVRYEHAQGMLFSDAPVLLVDKSGTFRGDGFRYHVQEKRFHLLGNVEVVQQP